MNRKRTWAVAGLVSILVVAGIGALSYMRFTKVEKAELVQNSSLVQIAPKLTYDGAYNGQLYLTGEKTGTEAPFNQLVQNMDRNGVTAIIAYFAVEADNRRFAVANTNTIIETIKAHPGRFVPFYSPGFGSEEAADMVGNELTGVYKSGLEYSKQAVTGGLMKGIGEVEAQVWQTSLESSDAASLFDHAAANQLSVMIHTRPDQNGQLASVLAKYPDTTFLLHMFANHFDQNRSQVISLMQKYPNLMYTIDADHLLFDNSGNPPIGLLYKYQDEDGASGAQKFNQDIDAKFDTLLNQALARYQPLIAAMPHRITIGTEMSADYTYEPESYDRIIRFIRYFVARQEPGVQEGLAYKNALRLFGPGVTLK